MAKRPTAAAAASAAPAGPRTTPAPAAPPTPSVPPRGDHRRTFSNTDERSAYATTFPVHVGVDCGKTFHKFVARGPDGRRTKAFTVDVSREGFDGAHAHLAALYPDVPPERVLVGIEFAGHHGMTFAHDLARRGYRVVSVLSSVTKKFKEAEDNSPRKDDAKDAAQICGLVGLGYFVGFPLLDATAFELRALANERQRLAVEETRLKNRLIGVLDLTWPEFAGFFSDIAKHTPLAVLERWPLPHDFVAAGRRATWRVIKEVSRNHIPKERFEDMVTSAERTVALGVAPDARRAEVTRVLTRWRVVREHVADVEARLAELVQLVPAAKALLSVPQVSVVCAATLVAELGDPQSYLAPRQVLKLAGMNLAGRESGTSVRGRIKQTKRGRPLLRRQLFLLAGRWCSGKGLYRDDYLALRARNGGKKTSAVCAIARKLVPMLLHVMQSGAAFDEATWRAGRQSPTPPAPPTPLPPRNVRDYAQSPYKAA